MTRKMTKKDDGEKKMLERIARILGFCVNCTKREGWWLGTSWRARWREGGMEKWQERDVPVIVNFDGRKLDRGFPSARELLEAVLEVRVFWWSTGPFSEKELASPFVGRARTLEELRVCLDVFEPLVKDSPGKSNFSALGAGSL